MNPLVFIYSCFVYICIGIVVAGGMYKNRWNPIWKLLFVIFWPIGFIFCVITLVIEEWVDEVKKYYKKKGGCK